MNNSKEEKETRRTTKNTKGGFIRFLVKQGKVSDKKKNLRRR